MKRSFFLFLSFFIIFNFALAAKPISISGKLTDLSSNPIQEPVVLFNIKIKNSNDCILYEEQFQIDMTGTSGYFKVGIFTGTTIFNSNGTDIFRDKTYLCKSGLNWVATKNDNRLIQVSSKVGSDPWVDFSSDVMNSVSYANNSDYFDGKQVSDFLTVNPVTTQSKIDQVMSQYNSIMDLINGLNTTYAKQSYVDSSLSTKQNSISFTPMSPSNNLSELTNKASARANLSLGVLATMNSVSNTEITSVDWTKVINKPTTYSPSSHLHVISDITNLTSTLNSKVDKSSFICSNTQSLIYNSVTDNFSCQDITLSGDLSGNLSSNQIMKIKGKNLSIGTLQDGMVIKYVQAQDRWEAVAPDTNTVPIVFAGEIIQVPFNCPTGTLLADGRTLNKVDYPDLYANIGCNVNCPNGSQFKIPDLRGSFLRGKNNGRSDGNQNPDGDLALLTIQQDQFKSHNHGGGNHNHNYTYYNSWSYVYSGGVDPNYGADGYVLTNGTVSNTTNSGNIIATEGGLETRPKNITVNYCIREKNR